MNSSTNIGKVILAGAGPGDPDLITIKAVNHLREAEVVLIDRLVSPVIVERYVPQTATVIEVGKQCRRGVSTPQLTINELLVRFALQGKKVVRLKGGDIAFFSNVLDELQVLAANHIPFEIIPGITAASGAAAYAGIPLTARNYATGVRLLTYYNASVIDESSWRELGTSDDTLVFYMSADTIGVLLDQLIKNGIDTNKQVAVIEQATTPMQQVYAAPVHAFGERFGKQTFLSPSLIIVGKVVELHHQFNWFESTPTGDYYFKPLTAQVEPLLNDTNQSYADRA